ncbi:MAG TPA: MFS transporter [Aliidongia sp.]|uniref:MFS transporter n=1 Tax=Aliidongia sp. TaxID=1914230 RepID=UPI002DDD7A95|nr:MFS transporter [Aliidongia sp.]HEV2673008.1 MFS transporter [Aliidongia sp.]
MYDILTHAVLRNRHSARGGKAAVAVVYAAALFQGLTLVSFPASSAILKQMNGLSDSQYGAIFLPQVACAVLGALAGGSLVNRLGLVTIFVVTLLANGLSQLLLAVSAAVPIGLAYPLILLGTAALGLGFGLGGGPLNSYPRLLFPTRGGSAILALHSVMGIGLTLGPLLVGYLAMRGYWLAFPLGLTVACLALLGLSAGVGFPEDAPPLAAARAATIKPTSAPEFWLFLGIAAVYAFAEGTFSNWAVIYVHESRGFSDGVATSSLAAFWAALVVGRLLVSALLLRIAPMVPWALLPILMIGAFLMLPIVATPTSAILGFALAGLACSAFFPLTVATASARFPQAVAFIASMLTAALMVGVGIASFVIGGLRDVLSLEQLYRASVIYPVLALVLIGFVVRAIRLRTLSTS